MAEDSTLGSYLKELRGSNAYVRVEARSGIPSERLQAFERGIVKPTDTEANVLYEFFSRYHDAKDLERLDAFRKDAPQDEVASEPSKFFFLRQIVRGNNWLRSVTIEEVISKLNLEKLTPRSLGKYIAGRYRDVRLIEGKYTFEQVDNALCGFYGISAIDQRAADEVQSKVEDMERRMEASRPFMQKLFRYSGERVALANLLEVRPDTLSTFASTDSAHISVKKYVLVERVLREKGIWTAEEFAALRGANIVEGSTTADCAPVPIIAVDDAMHIARIDSVISNTPAASTPRTVDGIAEAYNSFFRKLTDIIDIASEMTPEQRNEFRDIIAHKYDNKTVLRVVVGLEVLVTRGEEQWTRHTTGPFGAGKRREDGKDRA